jgi:transposase
MVTLPDLSRLSGAEKDALILALLERLEVAERRIAELEAKLDEPPKTPDNSSVPPSRGAKANTPERATRRGRRDGPGTARRLAAEPDRMVSFKASQCPYCAAGLDQNAQTVRAVYDRIEVPEIRPHVTRVHLFGGTCPCCAGAFTAAAEPGLEPGSPFGRSVEALVIYLHAVHAISFQRLSRLLGEVFGLAISEGAIANILARTRQPFLEQAEAITGQVRRAEVIGCDETSARVAGRTHWEWVFVTALCVLHIVRPRRAKAVVREILAGHMPRVWVSDRYGAQQGHGADWQVCLAHFLRDIQYALDAGDDLFARRLKRLILRALAIGRRRPGLKDGTLRQYRADLDRRLDALLRLEPGHAQAVKLRQTTATIRAHLFVFVTDRAVPPTNNDAERALRPSVIFRKVTYGFRSSWGADAYAAIRSVISTARLNGRTAFQAITATLKGQSVMPAA